MASAAEQKRARVERAIFPPHPPTRCWWRRPYPRLTPTLAGLRTGVCDPQGNCEFREKTGVREEARADGANSSPMRLGRWCLGVTGLLCNRS